jgi:hypothetical protein
MLGPVAKPLAQSFSVTGRQCFRGYLSKRGQSPEPFTSTCTVDFANGGT